MSARAGIVVTGTEVLTGRVRDANGPWLAEQLRILGVDVGQVLVVGDRPADLLDALAFLSRGNDVVLTTGGLGPTADDLTAALVARHAGRALLLDAALAERIAARVARIAAARGWDTSSPDLAAGVHKQAMVPEGAHVLEPTGTAPGLVVPTGGPPVVVLPGPPSELQAMWPAAVADDLVDAALAGRSELRQATLRLWGPPEAELAAVLRSHGEEHDLSGLEVSTCLREGQLEVVTRHSPARQSAYDALSAALTHHFGDAVYSTDARDVDDLVAEALLAAGATAATAESCTGGLVAARLTERAGSSAYVLGGLVTYANEAKTALAGVPADLIASVGAVSEEVAVAMAEGARRATGATYGLSTTGVAGPGGGTPAKPVGRVHVAIAWDGGHRHARLQLPGSRSQVRERTVVTLLHLLREVLDGRAQQVQQG
ncbi:competence/damage-inducible protein A [Nocardioides zeae]|uniref:CinA-like protein n=1 Tax=Nocardioides imazamoxiresistens TaxID=3231893 RepID=A0ABU3PU96_9ACTN|nr:competence/damage-inducible protein A [Nocardioides zeae]MDT9592365.1 competence/damage-inducible protein A [Nocardioides zeae]